MVTNVQIEPPWYLSLKALLPVIIVKVLPNTWIPLPSAAEFPVLGLEISEPQQRLRTSVLEPIQNKQWVRIDKQIINYKICLGISDPLAKAQKFLIPSLRNLRPFSWGSCKNFNTYPEAWESLIL